MTWKRMALLMAAVAMVTTSCSTRQKTGTLVGAGAGAAVGALVSDGVGGVLIGAAIGGAAGNLIGKEMDKQAKELKQAVPTAEVDRVQEGINMTFGSDLMFAINSSELKQSYKDDLAAAATVFNKYADTNLMIAGHTDDTGNDAINQPLSEQRAQSVKSYLATQNVASSRMTTVGYGSSQPAYPNDTPENQAKNRRVEIGVSANDEMVADAKAQTS